MPKSQCWYFCEVLVAFWIHHNLALRTHLQHG